MARMVEGVVCGSEGRGGLLFGEVGRLRMSETGSRGETSGGECDEEEVGEATDVTNTKKHNRVGYFCFGMQMKKQSRTIQNNLVYNLFGLSRTAYD